MARNEEPAEIEDVEVLEDKPGALLCLFPDGQEIWIPKSQIDEKSEVREHSDSGTLVIPAWLAKNEGLI